MTYKIENLVLSRLSQVKGVHPVPCKRCHELIIFVRTRGGGMVALDMELKKHECKKETHAQSR